MTAPLLECQRVTKTFRDARGPVDVLREVALVIRPGEFVILTGPSGSGKTTLLNLAALLDRPTAGTIRFDGRDVTALSDTELARIRSRAVGMVFQKFHLLPHRSVLENVLFRWRYVEEPADPAAAAQALARVGLADIPHRPTRLLSAGEMQRVAIARAVALPPRLLVADEPTGNLDGRSADAIMTCFRELNASGMTILMVTHNERLLDYGTRHLVCRDGRLE